MKTDAVILVDFQNGFIPEDEGGTGELGVVDGGKICSRVNEILGDVKSKGGVVIATRDWHPAGHISFSSSYGREGIQEITKEEILRWTPEDNPLSKNASFTLKDIQDAAKKYGDQMTWPDHCIAGTKSAEYYNGLNQDLIDYHVIKGMNEDTNVYSGFSGLDQEDGRTITDILRSHNARATKIIGLATDYCTKDTAISSQEEGFDTHIDSKAISAVGFRKGGFDEVSFLQSLREIHDINFI